jgi:ABC-type sugar transport system substrate-binding protein
MRRVAAVCIIVLAAVAWAAKANADAKGKRVALLGTLNTNPYMGAWVSTYIRVAEGFGMKVTNFSSPYDAAIQSQQVDDAIAQKFDMIVIDYLNDQAILPAFIRAKAAGVPVVLFGTPLQREHDDLILSYVGTDHEELGHIAGENMVKALKAESKTKASIAAITGVAQQLQVQQRVAAFRDVLKQNPGFELVAQEDGRWNTAISETIASQLLVRFSARGGIDGFLAMADNQATGIIQAIEAAGLKAGLQQKGIIVVASNCMKDGVLHIKSGEQFSTATQIPTEEAEAAAKKTAAYFNGEPIKKSEIIKSYAVTTDTLPRFEAGCSY